MSRPQQQRIAACLALSRRRWVTADFTPVGDTPVVTVPPKTCPRCRGFGYLAGPDGDPTRLSVCPGCHGTGRPPDGPDAAQAADDFRATVLAFVHARFESARRELHLQPAVRVVLDAGEAMAAGMVKDFFAQFFKETDVANTPNQPNPGQPANQAGQPQHAALTAAGVPQEHAAALAQHGVTPDQARKFAAVQGFNWGGLIQLVVKYGPAIAAEIAALFGA